MNKIKRNIFAILAGFKYQLISMFKSNLSIGAHFRMLKNSELRVYSGAKCAIGNEVKVDFNTVISVTKNANLNLSDNVGIGSNSMIVCHKNISIGENTILGPNVYIYDHDHKFSNERIMRKEYNIGEVNIGKNCWIGTGCIILKGTTIGDNCVIGAGTLLKGNYPPGSIIMNKRENIVKKI